MSEQNSSFPPHTDDASLSPNESKKEPLRFVSLIFDYVEIIVFSICAVLVLFMLVGRLCRVNGSSMLKTLHDGELLITTSIGEIERGDIVVFHQTSESGRLNEPLVKRVIATGGDTVTIDYTASTVAINGEVLDEPYAALIHPQTGVAMDHMIGHPGYNFDPVTHVFEVTVPEGSYFVLGDNRNNSSDSRTAEIGCVDGRRMLGRVVLRVKPWTTY